MKTKQFQKLFNNYKHEFANHLGIDLLKKIEEVTDDIFKTHKLYLSCQEILGKDKESIETVLRAVLESNYEGIKEYSHKFYKLYTTSTIKQKLTRKFIELALQESASGFNKFDRQLILHSINISSLYDKYYIKWAKAVRNSKAAKKIVDMQKEDPDKLNHLVKTNSLDNHYTIIKLTKGEEFENIPYSIYFKQDIAQICKAFEKTTSELSKFKDLTPQQKKYIRYLSKYSKCLSETNVDALENNWAELDELWMDIKYPIQIVHDIEYGYGDPLRTKIIPDFSLRFLDKGYDKENKTINTIKDLMAVYFKKRNSRFSKQGINALNNSFAGIYYLPFHTGMSCHFRFSGQSIPNRPKVKKKKGVKIYFDPVSTDLRMKQVKKLVTKVFADKSLIDRIDTIDSIVNHIAAHEFGHAIYNLASLEDKIDAQTKTLLEEPRAELTALKTMQLLHRQDKLTLKELHKNLFNFAASDLRRFIMYDSVATRAYIISALNTYKIYEQFGYITLHNNKLHLDDNRVLKVLDFFSDQFEDILNAEDIEDTDKLKKILNDMQKECDLVKWLVEKLFNNKFYLK